MFNFAGVVDLTEELGLGVELAAFEVTGLAVPGASFVKRAAAAAEPCYFEGHLGFMNFVEFGKSSADLGTVPGQSTIATSSVGPACQKCLHFGPLQSSCPRYWALPGLPAESSCQTDKIPFSFDFVAYPGTS